MSESLGLPATILLTSVDATQAIADRLASVLKEGDLILLTGGIGSGKTTFVQALARSLGVHEDVTSPSFVIQALYTSGRMPLSHVDLYRLNSRVEIEDIGLDDYLESAVTVVEWADRYPFFDGPFLALSLSFGSSDQDRALTVTAEGIEWADRVATVFSEPIT